MEKILILDYGSPHTQLVGRRVRELNVYCEIFPYNRPPEIDADVRGIILSGTSGETEIDRPLQVPILEIYKEGVLPTAESKNKLHKFVIEMCGCAADWTPATFIKNTVEELKTQLGGQEATCKTRA